MSFFFGANRFADRYVVVCFTLTHSQMMQLQGGEDPSDVLSGRTFSAKESLITGLFCGNIRHPVRHAHSLSEDALCS